MTAATPPRPPQEAREEALVDEFGIAAIERWNERGDHCIEAHETARAALLAHMRTEREGRQAAERDAARYRWLRDAKKSGVGYPMVAKVNTYGSYLDWNALIDGSLDTAIDAALAHSTGGKP